MAEKPIIFSTPMVRALLENRKTQTRRVITRLKKFGRITEFKPSSTRGYDWQFLNKRDHWNDVSHESAIESLPYQVGDVLWVRETIRKRVLPTGVEGLYVADETKAFDGWDYKGNIRPNIHMFRQMARISLKLMQLMKEF